MYCPTCRTTECPQLNVLSTLCKLPLKAPLQRKLGFMLNAQASHRLNDIRRLKQLHNVVREEHRRGDVWGQREQVGVPGGGLSGRQLAQQPAGKSQMLQPVGEMRGPGGKLYRRRGRWDLHGDNVIVFRVLL